MNTTKSVTRTAVIFAALTIAGICVAFSAELAPAALERTIMVAIGSAIFGAGLTFFLVRVSALIEK